MTDLTIGLIIVGISAALGWALKVQDTLTKHQSILDKLDQLISLLLEDRLAQSQKRGNS